MLKRLRIQNLSVVEDAELEFGPGLNVLTGSTGAGKSLILSAVNLLLGEKASPGQVRAGESRAEVEAAFQIASGAVSTTVFGLAVDGLLVLKREIRAEGRSQAYINGHAVTLKDLHVVSRDIVEPHGQNEQLRLRDPLSHVAYVDAYARHAPLLNAYAGALAEYRRARKELDEFERAAAALRDRRELLEHRVAEVGRAALVPGEREELERSLRVLENSERIHAALDFACQALYDDDLSALTLVSQSRKKVRDVGAVDESLARFATDIESTEIALREVVDGLRDYVEGMEFDPAQLRSMQERLDVLVSFERRYAMPIDELIAQARAWKEELDGAAFEDDRRRHLNDALARARGSVAAAASSLSAARRAAAASLDTRMTRELQTLMMKGSVFRTDVAPALDRGSGVVVDGVSVALQDDGVDVVHMCVRPNAGEPEGGVDRIASTGEASRIALALKKLTNAGCAGSVMIFDEIDAGVGADLGDVIAEKLLELSRDYQIVCITHMAQIAARGARHLVVAKRSARGRTWVDVTAVDGASRRSEIARMLGGAQGSERRMALADELLEKHSNRVRP